MLETPIRGGGDKLVGGGGGNQNKITRRTISRKPNESFHVRIAGNLVPRRPRLCGTSRGMRGTFYLIKFRQDS